MGVGRLVQLILYGVSAGLFFLTFYTLKQDKVSAIALSYGTHFQFLTILGLSVTFLAQIVGVVGVLANCSKILNIKDKLNILATPLALLISVLYWSIKFVDASLLIDPKVNVIPPVWLDLCMHAIPSVVEMIDVLWFGQIWTMGVLQALPLYSACAVGYWYWMHHTFSKNGFFPYPMMALMTPAQRMQLFAGAVLIICVSFKVVKTLQRGIRGQAPKIKIN